MEIAKLILEFLKVFFSPQIIAGSVAVVFLVIFKDDIKALLLRIAKIKFPGGAEVTTPQASKTESAPEDKPVPTLPDTADIPLPENLDPQQLQVVRELFNAERARSYLWEYRYLNFFLAYQTQQVLDWLSSIENRPSVQLFDTMWLPLIPSPEERNAIIEALKAHYLIAIENELIEVTPKGREYIQWRGPLPKGMV